MYRFVLIALCCVLPFNASATTGGFYVFADVNNRLSTDEFECVVKQGAALETDGTLALDDWRTNHYVEKGPFRFVAATGYMFFEDNDIIRWTMLYPGDEGNSLIAHRSGPYPMYSVFRLDIWNHDGIGFTWNEGNSFWAGICNKIK